MYPYCIISKITFTILTIPRVKPGARDLYANVLKVATPNNFYACNLALAAGMGQFHGMKLRSLTGGQCPVVVYNSKNKGKLQGKSGTARLVCYLVSDWKQNKLSPKLPPETIKKNFSFTTCPIYFDDVGKDSFIGRVTDGYDDGQTYETADGVFPKRAEIFFSANYFSMDEQASSDAEQVCDRLSVIPFEDWHLMSASELSRRQALFKEVVDCDVKPTELVIGEIGSFLDSPEFKQKRQIFTQWLYEKEEVIKPRTFLTNYAPFYAINWKLHQIFQSEWEKLGYSWTGFEEWAENVHIPFLVGQHIEIDSSNSVITRYVNGLLLFVAGMSETEVLKFMKICQTSKTKSKHVLAIHPDKRYPDLKQLDNIKLMDVKKHLPSVGGIWDDTTYATLLRADIDDLEATQNVGNSMVAKRALLIPMSVFTSSQIMKVCDKTGQKEYYSLADSETPSGVDEAINSTSLSSGSRERFALTDVSAIHVPSNNTLDEVVVGDQIFEDRDMTLTRVDTDEK